MSLSLTFKYIVVLPCEGSPYIWENRIFNTKTKEGKTELLNECREIVGGDVTTISDPSTVRIHPMFQNSWPIAQELLCKKGIKIYVNENGIEDCTPNMACLLGGRDYSSVSGSFITAEMVKSLPIKFRPLHGNVALVVPQVVLEKVTSPDALKYVDREEEAEE